MRCPACGFDQSPGANFCGRCGASLGARCPRCGAANPPDFSFCAACGARLTAGAAPQAREERKTVTVIFADVVGSTAATASHDPEEMRAILARFFAAMRGEVERFGGTVEKFIGDAVMAVFGLPRAHEDDPERAVRCARAMADGLAALNEEFRPLGVALQMRVGVNTGEVVADPRAAEKGEFLVTGDAVNLAARLQQAADPGEVLIGERTWQHVRGVVECAERAPLALKGRDAPLRVWRIGASLPKRRKRGLHGLRAAMIGREREIGLLSAHFAKAVEDRRSCLITVVGAAGIGKSRLQEEFTALLARMPDPPLILKGRCPPFGEAITLWPLAEILKDACCILDSDAAEAARGRLEAAAEAWVDDPDAARRTAEALGFAVGLGFPESELASMDPRAVREALLRAWKDIVESWGRRRPVVLVFEDLHWADDSLLAVVEHLADHAAAPVLLLCLARPEFLDRHPTWGGGKPNWSVVRLGPLSGEKSARLIAELLGTGALPFALRETILARSEGNPFFTEEIIRMLIDDAVLVREDSRWRARAERIEVAVPETVQGVLAARLDALPFEEKEVLQQASVIGRLFWLTPLLRLTASPPERLALLVDRLAHRELIEERDGASFAGEREFAFKHGLVRDVAYGALLRAQRAQPHAVVAAWLQDVAGERIDEFADLVAYHFHQAALLSGDPGVREQALTHLLLAGDVAARKYATSSAQRAYESALALAGSGPQRMTVLERLGDLQTAQWLAEAGWEFHRRAYEEWKRSGGTDPVAGARLCAKLVEHPTRWRGAFRSPPAEEEILRYIDEGLRLLEGRPDSVERGRLHAARGLMPNYTGREVEAEIREALAHSLEAARIMEQHGSARDLSAALDAVQGACRELGDYPAGLQANLRRWALRPRIADRDELVDIGCMMAGTRVALGDYEEGVAAAEWAVRLGEEAGLAGWHLHPLLWRTLALFEWDRWDEAARSADEFVRAGERYGPHNTWKGAVLVIAAIVAARRGQADRAAELARGAEEVKAYPFRPGTLHLPPLLLMASGETEAAGRALEVLCAGSGRLQPPVWSARLEAAAALADPRFASLHRQARELAARAGARKPAAQLRRIEGAVHLRIGRLDEARLALSEALMGFRALGTRWEAARTLADLAAVHRREGRKDEAGEAMREAEALFQELGAAPDLAALRAA